MPNKPKPNDWPRILSSADSFDWDVEVPRHLSRYDAKSIQSIVKLINRRGRVRWFEVWPDGREWRYTESIFGNVEGEDDLSAFLANLLEKQTKNRLVVNFDDRSDARAFKRELNQLNMSPLALKELKDEDARRREIAAKHLPKSYPPGRHKWVVMVNAARQDANQIDAWMRKHIHERYRVAVWRSDGALEFERSGYRYWRLTPEQWRNQIEKLGPDDKLLVDFAFDHDQATFDARYGPAQFITR
jgi:hypothetical protein